MRINASRRIELSTSGYFFGDKIKLLKLIDEIDQVSDTVRSFLFVVPATLLSRRSPSARSLFGTSTSRTPRHDRLGLVLDGSQVVAPRKLSA